MVVAQVVQMAQEQVLQEEPEVAVLGDILVLVVQVVRTMLLEMLELEAEAVAEQEEQELLLIKREVAEAELDY
jgi:hypothetical protein